MIGESLSFHLIFPYNKSNMLLKCTKHLVTLLFCMLLAIFLVRPSEVFAQQNSLSDLAVAQPIQISGAGLQNGSIISYRNGTYQLSVETYDKTMFGVISQNAAIVISQPNTTPAKYPVVTVGTTNVRVSTENGAIHKGDVLTSSSIPGVAMRANKSGFILGIAQGDYTSGEIGLVPVAVDVKFLFAADTPASEKLAQQLVDILKLSSVASVENPLLVFRYIAGAMLVIVTLGFAFISFARTAKIGTEALGRNPFATPQILTGMVFNIALAISILLGGLLGSYLLIR